MPSRLHPEGPLNAAAHFVRKHPFMCGALALVAAVSRSVQVGALGGMPPFLVLLLEGVVEGARVVLFLVALGAGSFAAGWTVVRSWFTARSGLPATVGASLPWRTYVRHVVLFLVAAGMSNGLIWLLVHESPAVNWLQQRGLLATGAPPEALTLLLKNLTVIPFTLVFIAGFARALSGPPAATSASPHGIFPLPK